MKCDLCNRSAVTFVRYNGSHLCGEHLMRYVEKRVKCEIRKQADLLRGGTIAVAVSGGKDSMVALHIIEKTLALKVACTDASHIHKVQALVLTTKFLANLHVEIESSIDFLFEE